MGDQDHRLRVEVISYCELQPSARLAPFVKCFWTLRGYEPLPARERILPDGSFELVLHLGDPFVADGKPQPRAMVVGEIRRPTIVAPAQRVDVFGVRFRVGAARSFFKMPMTELRDAILPLDDVMQTRLMLAESTHERAAIVEGRIDETCEPIVGQAIGIIRRSRGHE